MLYSIALGISVVLALISAAGGIVYFIWNLSPVAIIAVLIVSLAVGAAAIKFVFKKRSNPLLGHDPNIVEPTPAKSPQWAFGLIPFFILIIVCFILLARNQTDVAINTPWKQVPLLFWISLTLAASGGAALMLRGRDRVSFLTMAALIGIGTTVAAVIYKIGYGYDPFVHQAAEQHILDFGAIAPKTIYYAGQYSLVTIISFLTKLKVHDVDVWLLPIFAPLSIAGAACFAAKKKIIGVGSFAAALLIILPLGTFINTTPFGLAALYCLLTGIVGLAAKSNKRLKVVVWIFAAASLITHPIAGIPAVVLAACIQFPKPLAQALIAGAGTLILPALFAYAGKGFSFSLARVNTISLPFELPLTRFHAFGDPLYALGATTAAIIILAALWNRTYLFSTASAALSGILIAASIDFSYLPDSEQGGYAARLFVIALLIAAPAAAAAIGALFEKAAAGGWRTVTMIAVIAFFFVGGVYLAYPREDAYVISKGWNTSATDLSAVAAIDDDAAGKPYIVLAAQPVSAAALSKFGFFKYYDTAEGQIFAYPVPTGGVLYQYFLKMIHTDPTSEYMRQAMELAGVKRGYFVVNSYWTGADHIIGRAKKTADSWFGINKTDFVFRYSR